MSRVGCDHSSSVDILLMDGGAPAAGEGWAMTDEETGRRSCRQMRASLAAAYVSGALLIAVFCWDRDYDLTLAVLGIVNLVSVSLFSFHIGRVALLLGRNWVAWAFGSIVFSPAGALVAYLKMKNLARERAWWPDRPGAGRPPL